MLYLRLGGELLDSLEIDQEKTDKELLQPSNVIDLESAIHAGIRHGLRSFEIRASYLETDQKLAIRTWLAYRNTVAN